MGYRDLIMRKDLTKGSVGSNIFKLAIPIIGSSFMQLAYNFIDMLWVGRLGSNAVAAVGTSGFYLHLGWAFTSIILVGTGIMVSQSIGRKKEEEAKYISTNGWVGVIAFTVFFILLIQLFYKPMIGFFDMQDIKLNEMAYGYLRWASMGLIPLFSFQLFSKISNARGNSKTPFQVSLFGIILNIILDPIFIFTLDFGVQGAAIASIISQSFAVILFWNRGASSFFNAIKNFSVSLHSIYQQAKLGLPPSTQYMIFSLIAIIMAKIVSGFGSEAIAAQKIGHQIESLTFITIGGLNNALMSFTGQNYGAGLFKRIHSGYKVGIFIAISFGALMTSIFLIFPSEMMSWFVKDESTISIGANYLRIIGLSQIFMTMDMIASGVINGIGKTKVPATINIMMILIRVPLALFLSQSHMYGLNGVWYAILISTFLRGSLLNLAYHYIKNITFKKI